MRTLDKRVLLPAYRLPAGRQGRQAAGRAGRLHFLKLCGIIQISLTTNNKPFDKLRVKGGVR